MRSLSFFHVTNRGQCLQDFIFFYLTIDPNGSDKDKIQYCGNSTVLYNNPSTHTVKWGYMDQFGTTFYLQNSSAERRKYISPSPIKIENWPVVFLMGNITENWWTKFNTSWNSLHSLYTNSGLWSYRIEKPVLAWSQKLSIIESGQYQMVDCLGIPGTVSSNVQLV